MIEELTGRKVAAFMSATARRRFRGGDIRAESQGAEGKYLVRYRGPPHVLGDLRP